jgi:hypothetical protein
VKSGHAVVANGLRPLGVSSVAPSGMLLWNGALEGATDPSSEPDPMLGVVACAQAAPQPRNTITQAATIDIAGPRIEPSICFPLSASRKNTVRGRGLFTPNPTASPASSIAPRAHVASPDNTSSSRVSWPSYYRPALASARPQLPQSAVNDPREPGAIPLAAPLATQAVVRSCSVWNGVPAGICTSGPERDGSRSGCWVGCPNGTADRGAIGRACPGARRAGLGDCAVASDSGSTCMLAARRRVEIANLSILILQICEERRGETDCQTQNAASTELLPLKSVW